MTTESRATLRLPLRTTRLSTIRDVAMVAVCIALVASFVIDLWRSTPPAPFQALDHVAQIHRLS
jgi:hypothetical protein